MPYGKQQQKPRKKNKDLEHLEQVQLMEWADHPDQWAKYPELELLHAIPNGGKRDGRTAGKLKNEGVKAGVPDLFLPAARLKSHGLYIEMKTEEGKTSAKQDRFIKLLRGQDYLVTVCRSHMEARSVLLDYLEGIIIY